MNELRPIGTEFEIEYPPIEHSNFIKRHTLKYRIIAHKRTFRFLGDKEGVMGEVVEAIGEKKND